MRQSELAWKNDRLLLALSVSRTLTRGRSVISQWRWRPKDDLELEEVREVHKVDGEPL
jgi:hypothetical protein